MQKMRGNLASLIIGGLLVAVIGAGTAVAATGQVVNIADGTNEAHVAKVDASGALRTTAVVAPQGRPLATQGGYIYDNTTQTYTTLLPISTSVVALNRIIFTPSATASVGRSVSLYQFNVPNGSPCVENAVTTYRPLGMWRVKPDETLIDTFPTAIVLKPVAGQSWCLVGSSIPISPEANYFLWADVSGWVISGTAPAGTTASASAKAPARPKSTLGREPRRP
ncbi:MAG: hypothetical protein JO214_05380 [Frankiaceae bacterium]|nr:hypothetical protein [Frankiaceae bacterium]